MNALNTTHNAYRRSASSTNSTSLSQRWAQFQGNAQVAPAIGLPQAGPVAPASTGYSVANRGVAQARNLVATSGFGKKFESRSAQAYRKEVCPQQLVANRQVARQNLSNWKQSDAAAQLDNSRRNEIASSFNQLLSLLA